jgi:glycosyltransferase involved in cell wall biosynthesis
MKICAYFHLFPPEHNAGSETTVHAALRALVNRGHIVNVICDRSKTAPYEVDGIQVVRPPRRGVQSWLESFAQGSDLLVTHLDLTSQAMTLAMAVKIPLVHFVHNDAQLMYWRADARVPYKNALTVYNSNWLAEKPSHWGGQYMPDAWRAPHIIVHPIVEPERYRCERGTKITLVNPTPTKGANVLRALARQMPDREFLAVEGGYGDQIITAPGTDPRYAATGNIEWMAHTPDIRKVFRKTKILLMPSDYESYGRVGIEAACAGIPTIAHPTEGLKEAFGDAGIFIDRNDIAAWYLEIDRLLTDNVYYRQRSNAVLALADSLDPEGEFDRLEQAFIETAQRYQTGENKSMRMWESDAWIWKLQDGNYKKTSDRRIPVDAVTLFAGIGTMVPEDLAKQNGWIGPDESIDEKAIAGPAENKAIESPEENKTRGRKKKEGVAA